MQPSGSNIITASSDRGYFPPRYAKKRDDHIFKTQSYLLSRTHQSGKVKITPLLYFGKHGTVIFRTICSYVGNKYIEEHVKEATGCSIEELGGKDICFTWRGLVLNTKGFTEHDTNAVDRAKLLAAEHPTGELDSLQTSLALELDCYSFALYSEPKMNFSEKKKSLTEYLKTSVIETVGTAKLPKITRTAAKEFNPSLLHQRTRAEPTSEYFEKFSEACMRNVSL